MAYKLLAAALFGFLLSLQGCGSKCGGRGQSPCEGEEAAEWIAPSTDGTGANATAADPQDGSRRLEDPLLA
jgi:hypothetical protein